MAEFTVVMAPPVDPDRVEPLDAKAEVAPRRTGLGLFAAGWAFLLPVVFSPSVGGPFWAPKAALLPVMAVVGLVRLPALLWASSPVATPARWAVGFGGIAVLSTVLAANHTTAVFGLYGWGTGLIFVLTLVGAWAVGASLDERQRGDVQWALLAALLVNVLIAILAVSFDLSTFQPARGDGRAYGLLGNPVHLGAYAAGGLALLIPLFRRRWAVWALPVALTAATVQVSGSRFALVLTVLVAVAALRPAWRIGLAFMLVVLVGLGAGTLLSSAAGTSTASTRLGAGSTSSNTPRFEVWKGGMRAVADRPLIGAGPGNFRTATSRYRTAALVLAEGPDQDFTDAHNIFVEYATTLGLFGAVALVGWLVTSIVGGRGALFGFGVIVLAMHLVEPQWVATTPLAFLGLGAGRAGVGATRPLARWAQGLTAALCAVAVLAGGTLLVGTYHLRKAQVHRSEAHASAALRLLPRWSEAALAMAVVTATHGSPDSPATVKAVRAWQREAVSRDPASSYLWNAMADTELDLNLMVPAREHFAEALRIDPVSVHALNGLGHVALLTGHRVEARDWFRRSISLQPGQAQIGSLLRALEKNVKGSVD